MDSISLKNDQEYSWKVRKRWIAPKDRGLLPFISKIIPCPIESNKDPRGYKTKPVVLITGDGHSLFDDIKQFKSFGIDHDLYCVNKSLLAVKRPVNHWAAIDGEESFWLAENFPKEVIGENGHRLGRHTIGVCKGYDVFWQIERTTRTDETGLLMWTGSTTYFAILSSLWMGYDKIIIAGAPLDSGHHWYDPPGTPGPNWADQFYRTWLDFSQMAEAKKVRALSGYSKIILGAPTKDWINGE